MIDQAKRLPAGVFLLRKSHGGVRVPLLKNAEFPLRFLTESGREYVIERTRAGRVIMKSK